MKKKWILEKEAIYQDDYEGTKNGELGGADYLTILTAQRVEYLVEEYL